MRQTLSIPIILLLLLTLSTTPFGIALQLNRLVDIPDLNLRAAIEAELGKNAGDRITEADMLTLRTLWIGSSNNPITDLTGLAFAENLIELDLWDNNISDISPLAGLTKLTYLDLGYNNISDISPLTGLVNLEDLWLYENNISDISPLADLTKLTALGLDYNNISDVSPLAGLTKLTELYLDYNRISDFSPIAGLVPNLDTYWNDNQDVGTPNTAVDIPDPLLRDAIAWQLGKNSSDTITGADMLTLTRLEDLAPTDAEADTDYPVVEDLTGLEFAENLTVLQLGGNNISDISPLAGLTKLTVLGFSYNNISDVSPLAGLVNLEQLYLEESDISDISPLARLTKLTKLYLRHNNISDISPLAGLTKLTVLDLVYNNISDVSPLAGLMNLENLWLQANFISDISPLARLTKLTVLGFSYNNISDVSPLAGLVNLEQLYLEKSDISDIPPLARLTKLTKLYLRHNNISDISPLAGLTKLTVLDLGYNNISDISPLARLTKLTKLYLNSNRISDFSPIARLIPNLEVYEYDNQEVEDDPQPSATVSLSPASVASPAVGQHLTFRLNITGGENIAGYQAIVNFDPGTLRYVESANGDYLPAEAYFLPPKISEQMPGTFTLAAASLAEVDIPDLTFNFGYKVSLTLPNESQAVGTLATFTFEVLEAFASPVMLSDVVLTDRNGNPSYPLVVDAEITERLQFPEDVNQDGIVDIVDLTLVASNFNKQGQLAADVNGDQVVDIRDLTLVAGAFGTFAASPSVWLEASRLSLNRSDVASWLRQARAVNISTPSYARGLEVLEQLLAALTPTETALLANYPNPFNPETWIPYHLAEPAAVTLTIYAIDGQVVRRLDLGHQTTGYYQNKARAAYWDGRNNAGEPVASGLYFYTLTAGKFAATRKMLIRK